MLDLTQLLRVPHVDALFEISPDNSKLAFAWNKTGGWQDKIQAPVQMICGGNDPRCPASDSIDTRDKLIERGKSVDFHLYEDEGHAFLKIENIIDSETKRVEFLAKALDS